MPTPHIVAEVSCNHLGSISRALELIATAKSVGADSVKFQCWTPERMSIDRTFVIPSGPWAGYTLPKLYAEAHTPMHWFPELFSYAERVGIECFASVFDIDALAYLESLNCPRYKIASFEITDLPLIEAVAKTGKPVVISTGMATREEISCAEMQAFMGGATDITTLKCTSAYPAHSADANLATMVNRASTSMQRGGEPDTRIQVKVGLSDHTLGSTVAIAATALGATMIEKHLTLSRADGGPDAGFSSEPHEFKRMTAACREAAAALGTVRYGPTEAELPSLIYRRSLYARHDLYAGEPVTPELFVFADRVQSSRPALGLPPSFPLVGRVMARDVRAGSPIVMGDLVP